MNVQGTTGNFAPFSMSSVKVGSVVAYSTDLTSDDKNLMAAAYGPGWDKNGSGPNSTMKVNVMAFGIVAARRDGTLDGPVTTAFITQEFGDFSNMKKEVQAALDYLQSQSDGLREGKNHPVDFTT